MPLNLDLPPLRWTRTTLANGLDVIVRRQGSLPIAAVNLWYHVGSKNESPRRRGFAHLFEHLMFEGSQHYPGDFFKPLQRIGAGVNGSTSVDRTNYYVDAPVAHLELPLAMESDRMGFLLPALTDEKLAVQKGVVTNEFRQNYENRPYGMAWAAICEALYPEGHPYRWLTIGDMGDVAAATREEVEAFFRLFYVPRNASLAIVGDVDEDEALRLAERYFGTIPAGNPPGALPRSQPSLARSTLLNLPDRVELERAYDTWPTVPQFDPDDAPLMMLADVLGRGRSSRLYRDLVESGIAQDFSVHQSGREIAGTFSMVVTLRPGRTREEARGVLNATLARVARDGVSNDELERARTGRLAGFLYALDGVGGFGGVADRLNAYNIYRGDPGEIRADWDRFRNVTAEDIARVAANHLVDRPRVTLDVVPRPSATVVPLDRRHAPSPRAAVPFRAPVPEVLELACGSALWVIPRPDLPIVSAAAVVAAGASSQPVGRSGLAHLTSLLLDEGTSRRTAHQIAAAAEDRGAHLSASCGHDGAYVSFQSLAAHLGTMVELAAEILTVPTFPRAEFDRLRAQSLAALRSERDRAEARAHRCLLRSLYPKDHPYAMPVEGDIASVSRIETDDLVAFHRATYTPDRTAWVVAGDVDAEELRRLLDAQLPGRPASTGSRPDSPAVPPRPTRPRILLLDRPAAPQAVLRAGHVGLNRLDPDYHAWMLFNHVLGGLFTSRLNERLRERMGVTYGVRSHADARIGAGPFVIGASIQADRLAEALTGLREELAAILDDRPPTAAELADARRSLIEGQPRYFETPPALASRFAGLWLHGLPPDEHSRLADRLEGLTREDILAAGARQLHPDALTYVVVADAGQVGPELERLGWVEVERMEDELGASAHES